MDPIRPSSWDICEALRGWSGNPDDLPDHVIQTNDIQLVPAAQTAGQIPRVELTPRLAMQNRRAYGFIVEIHESGKMLNADTKYRFSAIAQLVYFLDEPDGPRADSWFWAKTSAFSRNLTITDPECLTPGDIAK